MGWFSNLGEMIAASESRGDGFGAHPSIRVNVGDERIVVVDNWGGSHPQVIYDRPDDPKEALVLVLRALGFTAESVS